MCAACFKWAAFLSWMNRPIPETALSLGDAPRRPGATRLGQAKSQEGGVNSLDAAPGRGGWATAPRIPHSIPCFPKGLSPFPSQPSMASGFFSYGWPTRLISSETEENGQRRIQTPLTGGAKFFLNPTRREGGPVEIMDF